MPSREPIHHIHIPLSGDELIRARQLASRNNMPMTQYVRMLIAQDWGDYKTQQQKDLDWMLSGEGHEPSVTLESSASEDK